MDTPRASRQPCIVRCIREVSLLPHIRCRTAWRSLNHSFSTMKPSWSSPHLGTGSLFSCVGSKGIPGGLKVASPFRNWRRQDKIWSCNYAWKQLRVSITVYIWKMLATWVPKKISGINKAFAQKLNQRLYDQWCRKIPFRARVRHAAAWCDGEPCWFLAWIRALVSRSSLSMSLKSIQALKAKASQERLSRPNCQSYSLPKKEGGPSLKIPRLASRCCQNFIRNWKQKYLAVQCWPCSARRFPSPLCLSRLDSMTGLKAFHVAISHSAEDVFGLFGHGARSLHQ